MLGDLRSFDLFDLTAGARNSLQRIEFTYILCAPRLSTFRDFMSRFSGARTALNETNEGSPESISLTKCRKVSIHC
ncbi:hypothetical protein CGCF415_v004403 [Colletotrichum fructicola]|uniref:Uncharacterized protein n=1 Tax=Colletotrichum fructicola (strain Nara gc5) TaxID=1213859 RepID=A0A7J6ITY5_COLFN|nr:hypothetical protein CGGC5_v011145 [Colletotrichum fructicola Nara gc5]KAF4901028.1 hypothetical protein CGCFRS4_v002986 [Colletotrichum fructicola]KAF4911424.1 hypothetical protein CGCF415_v004403 [Colletotrichum fructicola]KAF4939235.1 hypothetical protein CGCF245_v003798 [Colletotrichum fructicola]